MFDHSLDSVDLLLDLCHPEELRFELTAHLSELLVDHCEDVCAVHSGASRAARVVRSWFFGLVSETTDTAGASNRAVMNRHCSWSPAPPYLGVITPYASRRTRFSSVRQGDTGTASERVTRSDTVDAGRFSHLSVDSLPHRQ